MAQKSLLSFFTKPVENENSHEDEEMQELVNEEDENLLAISDTEAEEVDTEVTTSSNKKCKIDRIRQYDFKNNWLKQFTWLRLIDLKSKKVYCAICKEEKVGNTWAREKLIATWRVYTFQYHEQKDKDHLNAVAAQKNRPQNFLKESVSVLTKKANEGVEKLMKNVLFCVQQNIPLSGTSALHDLLIDQCETAEHKINLPSSHKSSFSTYNFLSAINESVFKKEIKKLREVCCFNLHLDESTDITEQKHLILYYTALHANESVASSRFLAMLKVDYGTADVIMDQIVNFFERNRIDMRKIVLFTSDGAAVMLGKCSGVAQKLREEHMLTTMIDMHCVAHREALAIKDVLSNKSPHYWSIELQTKELISFLSNHNARIELEKLCEILEETYLAPQRIYEIRWLSRYGVVTYIIRMMLPILTLIESMDETKYILAKALKKKILDYGYVLLLHAMADLLEPLNRLMLHFQYNIVHPFDVNKKVESALSVYNDMLQDDVKSTGRNMTALETSISDRTSPLLNVIRNKTITDVTRAKVLTESKDFARKIVKRVKERLSNDNNIFKAFLIFVPKPEIADISGVDRVQYGKDEIKTLVEFYSKGPFKFSDDIYQEWDDFKRFTLLPACKDADCQKIWIQIVGICAEKTDLYPNLNIMAKILLSFNAQNTVVERAFR